VYTDASKQETGRVGIGVTDNRTYGRSERLSDKFQITNAELVAILRAVVEAEKRPENKIVILTDSMNGCDWIEAGLKDNYLVHLIRGEMARMSEKEFTLQWVPSHVGINGNERADEYANQGCLSSTVSKLKITFSDARCESWRKTLREWQEEYQATSARKGKNHYAVQGKVTLKPWFAGTGLNGNEIKTLTRLRTFHGLCGVRRQMFRLSETDQCERCGVCNDLDHIIMKCEKYSAKRILYPAITNSDNLVNLLKEIDMDRYRAIIAFCREAEVEV